MSSSPDSPREVETECATCKGTGEKHIMGLSENLTVNRMVRCPKCKGSGTAQEAEPLPCANCGDRITHVWYAPSDLWNEVTGSPNGFLCLPCFDQLAHEAGHSALIWTVETSPREVDEQAVEKGARALAAIPTDSHSEGLDWDGLVPDGRFQTELRAQARAVLSAVSPVAGEGEARMKNEGDTRFDKGMNPFALVGMMIELDPRGGQHFPEDKRAFLALWNDVWLPALEVAGVEMDQPFADMLGPRTLDDFPARAACPEGEAGLREALTDLLEVAEDMRAYVPEYFATKWEHDEGLARAREALSPPGKEPR